MKLELKHLAPYLPYGLKMTRNGFIGELKSIKSDGTITVSCSDWFENINDGNFYKPILRPLSDLRTAKLFDNYGDEKLTAIEEFDGNWDLGQYDWVLTEVSYGKQLERLLELSYNVIDKLIEHHFDVFGLIDNGLAIDINQTNPDQDR